MDNNLQNIGSRFSKYLSIKGLSMNKAAKLIGFSTSQVANIVNGKKYGTDKLLAILNYFDKLNPEWLIKGEGEPEIESIQNIVQEPTQNYTQKILPIVVDSKNNEKIPFIETRALAGYVEQYQEPEFVKQLPMFSVPDLNNATFRMFEVDGHSMEPTLKSKDIAIGEYCEDLNHIREGRVYIIVTLDNIFIKRVYVNSKEQLLVLKSDNQTQGYDPIIMPFREVGELWYIKRVLTGYLSEPTDIYQRIADLETDYYTFKQKIQHKD